MTQAEPPRLSLPVGERDHVEGPATAPVTLVEYGDYECPYCRATVPIVRGLRQILGDQLRYVYRHFPLAGAHPRAQQAAEVAEAAGAQGKFWEMHARLFEQQSALADEDLLRYGADLGLDAAQFQRDLTEHRHAARVREDYQSGLASGVGGTPTFYLDGVRYDRLVGLQQLLVAIRQAHPEVASAGADVAEQRLIPRVVRERSRLRPPARQT
jgi:protein-disulfide isomerase